MRCTVFGLSLLIASLASHAGPRLEPVDKPYTPSKRESRCANRCDTMRYACSQSGTPARECQKGRYSCMERCMGEEWKQYQVRRQMERDEHTEAGD